MSDNLTYLKQENRESRYVFGKEFKWHRLPGPMKPLNIMQSCLHEYSISEERSVPVIWFSKGLVIS